jgi:hypothetical protein
MRAALRAITALALLCAICAGPARATSFERFELQDVVRHAENIFVGTVSQKSSRRDTRGVIVTDVTFSSVESLYGAAPVNGELSIEVFGGEIGGVKADIAGVPPLVTGQRYLMFTFASGKYYYPIVGGAQGMYMVKSDAATGAEKLYNAYGHVMVDEPLVRHMANTVQPTASPMTGAGQQTAAPVMNESTLGLDAARAAIRQQMSLQKR